MWHLILTMSGGTVKVSINDNGIGMTEEQLKHVFEEFYKVDDSRNDRCFYRDWVLLSVNV